MWDKRTLQNSKRACTQSRPQNHMMSASTDETSTPNKWQLQQTNKCEQGESLPKTIESELDRLGANRRWVWWVETETFDGVAFSRTKVRFSIKIKQTKRMLFLIGTLPNILNGFHVSSYVFVGRMPDEYWCEVTALRDANWTRDNVITISTGRYIAHECPIYTILFNSTCSERVIAF